MKNYKNLIMVFLLLSVFTVGTLSFVETVDAACWKKYDSGKIITKNPKPRFKKTVTYVSYEKNSNTVHGKYYGYKTKNNQKKLIFILFISKDKNKGKMTLTDFTGKKIKRSSETFYSGKYNAKILLKKSTRSLIG